MLWEKCAFRAKGQLVILDSDYFYKIPTTREQGIVRQHVTYHSTAGIPVTATASRESSKEWCLKLGAADVVGHGEIRGLADGSFPRIVCAHDTDAYFAEMARLVAPQGFVCAVAGAKQKHDIQPLMAKSAGFVWELMFTRSLFQTDDMAKQGEILRTVAQLVDGAVIQTTLTDELSGLSAATFITAHKRLEEGRMIGKLVVRFTDPA